MFPPLPEAAGAAEPRTEASAARRRRIGLAGAAALLGIALLALLLRREAPAPPQAPEGWVLFADVDGWYRHTPAEVAVRARYDLRLEGLPGSLPLQLGPWQGEERAADAQLDRLLADPEVSLLRTYRRPDGELVWLSALGHRGGASYHLFEHAPEICYPFGGWRIDEFAPRALALGEGPRPLTVNHGVATHENDGRRMVFLYVYLWDQPGRAAEDGILSFRVAAPVREDPEATLAMLREEFLPEILDTTLSWRRF